MFAQILTRSEWSKVFATFFLSWVFTNTDISDGPKLVQHESKAYGYHICPVGNAELERRRAELRDQQRKEEEARLAKERAEQEKRDAIKYVYFLLRLNNVNNNYQDKRGHIISTVARE